MVDSGHRRSISVLFTNNGHVLNNIFNDYASLTTPKGTIFGNVYTADF